MPDETALRLPAADEPKLLESGDSHQKLLQAGGVPPIDRGSDRKQDDKPTPPARKKVLIVGAIIVVLLLLIMLITTISRHRRASTLGDHAKAAARNDSIPQVTVEPVKRAKAATALELPGTVQAMHEAALYARTTGYVQQFKADIGQWVKAGQSLATIDAPDIDQQYQQSRADSARASSALQLSATEVRRWRLMYRDSVVTREELDQKLATYGADSAQLASATANVRRMRALLDFKDVRAPFAGVVTARNIEQGVLITSGGTTNTANAAGVGGNTVITQTPGQTTGAGASNSVAGGGSSGGSASSATVAGGGSLFRVAQIDTVRIYVGIPQTYAAQIRAGMRASVTVREVSPDDFHGQVARVAQAYDASSRTMLTEVDVTNANHRLLPGMFAQVKFQFDLAKPPLLLPAGALVVRNAGPQAVVVGKDSAVHFRTLAVGRDLGTALEVDSGVVENDMVVSNAPDDLREGQHVRPSPRQDQGAAGGNTPGGRPANPPPNDSAKKGGAKGGKRDSSKSDVKKGNDSSAKGDSRKQG